MQKTVKICIVGAGPAGVTTALFLAKKGIKSLLIDKAVFPRHKPCGDNISGNTIRILDELGANFIPELVLAKKALPVNGLVAYAPNHHKLKLDFQPLYPKTKQPSCYSIPRIDFDNELIKKAKTEPLIEVIEGFRVTNLERQPGGILLKDNNRTIFANLAIICSGSNANFINKIHPVKKEAKHFGVGVRAYFKNITPCKQGDYDELFLDEGLLPGGIYISPFADKSVNVNVVVRNDVVKKRELNLKEVLHETLNSHPVLKQRFAKAEQIGKTEGSGLFLGTKKRKISGDNFMLVGDAAGLIDLISANGIPQAMLSGKIAAEFAEKCVRANDFSSEILADYDDRVFERVKNYLKKSRLIAPFLSFDFVLKIFSKAMGFIAKKYDSNDQLRDLIYDQNADKKLLAPKFYYKLFFGIKNSESL